MRGRKQPAFKSDKLTAVCEPNIYKNMGYLISHNLMGLQGLLQGYLSFFALIIIKFNTLFLRANSLVTWGH
jgi:hypothetical protein